MLSNLLFVATCAMSLIDWFWAYTTTHSDGPPLSTDNTNKLNQNDQDLDNNNSNNNNNYVHSSNKSNNIDTGSTNNDNKINDIKSNICQCKYQSWSNVSIFKSNW